MLIEPLQPRLDDFQPEDARRILLAISCPDTAKIPKIPNAGQLTVVRNTSVQMMHNGVVVEKDCYQGPWMTEIIRCLHGHHEPQEELVFYRILERIAATESQPCMVELGCWWAYYSLWFLRSVRGSVLALEPDPCYIEVGRRNFELNGERGTFVQGAIGDQPGMPLSFNAESDGKRHQIEQQDLASLLALGGIDRVSVLLADIQGAETALVERSRKMLNNRHVRFLLVSTHHHLISGSAMTHQKTLAVLQEMGAHVIAEHTVGESFSGDGLIAVSFDPQDRDMHVDISRARQRESVFGELELDLEVAKEEIAQLREYVRAIQGSLSWRATEPLRWLTRKAGIRMSASACDPKD